MARWHLKLARDTAKSLIPVQPSLRRLKRRLLPYNTNPRNDEGLLADCRNQILVLNELGISIRGSDVVEIGSGWTPVLPLVYHMAGARHVTTVDQERLIDRDTMLGAIELIRSNWQLFEDFGWAPPSPDITLGAMLHRHSISYLAPGNFGDLPLLSADLIVSRAVFEHIPPQSLDRITEHSRRVLRQGGYVCHSIDMSDHWEHGDKSISRVNFLRYNDKIWSLTGLNGQCYQNRMRRFEYLQKFREHGFTIVRVDGAPDPSALSALKTMPICTQYVQVPHEELAVVSTMIVARCPAELQTGLNPELTQRGLLLQSANSAIRGL
jgi:SAM-dependent methyltransferase